MYIKSAMAAVAFLTLCVSSASADPAYIVRGNGCGVYDATGALFFDSGAQGQFIFTNTPNGYANFRCQGNMPAGGILPSRAIQYNYTNTGMICIGGDESWQETVTPTGRFTLTCHLH